MKRLYGENDEWTEDGRDLDREIDRAIRQIIKDRHAAGYSIRDIESIVISSVSLLCAETKVRSDMDARRAAKLAREVADGDK